MSIVDTVQKMAKTAIIEEKLDNLNKKNTVDDAGIIPAARKAVIKAYDKATMAGGDNSGTQPGIVVDGAVNGASHTGTTTTGFPPTTGAINTVSTGANDSINVTLNGNNQNDTSNTDTSTTKKTDDPITGGSGFQGGGGGGSNSQNDTLKTEIQNLKDSLIAGGASEAEANAAIRPTQQANGMNASGVEKTDDVYNNTYNNVTPSAQGTTPGVGADGSTKIRAITGTDPISGDALVLFMNNVPEGGSFIPSIKDSGIDWTGANTPPLDPSYVAGSYWYLSNGPSSVTAQGFSGLVAAREAIDNTTAYSFVGLLITSTNPQEGDDLQFGAAGHNVGDSTGSVGGTQVAYSPSGTGASQTYGVKVCAGTTGDAAITCAIPTAPHVTKWPVTGTAVRYYANGVFNNYVFDTLSNALYPVEKSFATIVSNAVTYKVGGAINGGWYIEKASPSASDYGMLFRSDGSFVQTYPQSSSKFYKLAV